MTEEQLAALEIWIVAVFRVEQYSHIQNDIRRDDLFDEVLKAFNNEKA